MVKRELAKDGGRAITLISRCDEQDPQAGKIPRRRGKITQPY
jgi:hypothetical protein